MLGTTMTYNGGLGRGLGVKPAGAEVVSK